MSRIPFDRPFGVGLATVALVGAMVGVTPRATPAQTPSTASKQAVSRILSSEVAVSRQDATLKLEFADGRSAEFAIRDGQVFSDGRELGKAERGGALDRAWRELLNEAMDAPTARLSGLLRDWNPPAGETGSRLDASLEAALQGVAAPALPAAPTAPAANAGTAPQAAPGEGSNSDSVSRLIERIQDLQQQVSDLEQTAVTRVVVPRSRGVDWLSPFRRIMHGLAGILSLLVSYAVLFGIGFGTIYFGGRKYIEGVADTARKAPMRSLLVGLAGSFLVFPAFILGIIALAISIVGIPALLIWVPLFPVALGLAALLGYLAVGHAAGEALAERRFYATDWFQRANSYYFLLTGLGLLMAFFLAGQVISMAPFLGFFAGLLKTLGVVTTWSAITLGFGAVLLSRAGTRPLPGKGRMSEPEIFAEETHA